MLLSDIYALMCLNHTYDLIHMIFYTLYEYRKESFVPYGTPFDPVEKALLVTTFICCFMLVTTFHKVNTVCTVSRE